MNYAASPTNLVNSGSVASGVPGRLANTLSKLKSDTNIFTALKNLAITLDGIHNVSSASFVTVPSAINEAHRTFNTFAVVSADANSELLPGLAVTSASFSRGFTDFTRPQFTYNDTSPFLLSSGETIVSMEGAPNAPMNGKKWMAAAYYKGDATETNFLGILLWVFTGIFNDVDRTTFDLNKTSDIFYQDGYQIVNDAATPRTKQIYQAVIGSTGDISASYVGEEAGWNFSNSHLSGVPTVKGYLSNESFSADDGLWGFNIGGEADGNGTAQENLGGSGAVSYGAGNQQGVEPSGEVHWGSLTAPYANWVAFIFTSDRPLSL